MPQILRFVTSAMPSNKARYLLRSHQMACSAKYSSHKTGL